MSKQSQIQYKMKLISKLTDFLLNNDDLASDLPKDANFIVQSDKLKEFSKEDDNLIERYRILKENVVVAREIGNNWTFKKLIFNI